MSDYHKSKAAFHSRGVTLNRLKDELHSLNMRMLLAMQNHSQELQEEIKEQITCVQDEIDRMSAGGGHRHMKES